MNTNTAIRRVLSIVLSVCLVLPGTAATAMAGGKSGKKNFKEGIKYEQLQQWDLAAQEFALAVAAEPDNAEYKLHYFRALQNASVMFTKRGDELARQADYGSAYNAYRQAYGYDQANELAKFKQKQMLELQKQQAMGLETMKYDEQTGNFKPANNDLLVAPRKVSKDVVRDITFKDIAFKDCTKNLAKELGLNVLFDETVKDTKVNIELREVSLARAFDLILLSYKYAFEQVDKKTIMIYQDSQPNRLRFERVMVKTFYLGNIKSSDARQLVTQLLGGRQATPIDDLKLMVVKATPSELQLLQDVLESIDKNLSEVVIDVEIYEVSNDSMTQIGNQIATSPTDFVAQRTGNDGRVTQEAVRSAGLNNLGGLGLNIIDTTARAGNALFSLGAGALIGLPPTTLSFLQSRGRSKLLAKTQIHALDNQQNNTKVGRSVPVRVGTNYGAQGGFGAQTGFNQGGGGIIPGQGGVNQGFGGGGFGGGFGGGGGLFDNIQYKDVGLVIDVTPKITNQGYVEIKMKLETSNVEAGADGLNPSFSQRSLSTTARIQDGTTAIVASVKQDSKTDSRSSIPILGMIPVLGRFFTTPNQSSRESDIVITVTPHIIRTAEITREDHLARLAGVGGQGAGGSGLLQTIEEVLYRAQKEEEDERRLIALQRGVPIAPSQTSDLTAPPAGVVNTGNVPVQNVNNDAAARKGREINNDTFGLKPVAGNAQNFDPGPPPVQPEPPQYVPTVNTNSSGAPNINPYINPNNLTPDTPPGNPGNPGNPNTAGEAPIVGTAGGEARVPGERPPGEPSENQPNVPQAIVRGAPRPPQVEQAIQEMILKERLQQQKLREQQAAAGKTRSAAPKETLPVEFIPTGPKQPVAPAVPKTVVKPAAPPAGASGAAPIEASKTRSGNGPVVTLSLAAAQAQMQVGKTVSLNVQLDAQAAMSSANIALKFDSSKLQLKSVRDGGMLGNQPGIEMSQTDSGSVLITVKPSADKGVKPAGRLIVVEFLAVAEGSTEVSFNGNDTQVTLTGNQVANVKASSVQLALTAAGKQ